MRSILLLLGLILTACSPRGFQASSGSSLGNEGPTSSLTLLQAVSSSPSFQNFSFPTQSGSFMLDFDVMPLANDMAGSIDITSGPATSSVPIGVDLNANGAFDALNGASPSAEQTIPYLAQHSYHVELDIDVAANEYTAIVTPDGDIDQVLGIQYSFGASVTSLNNFAIDSSSGSFEVYNVKLSVPIATDAPAPAPSPAPAPAPSPSPASTPAPTSSTIISVNSSLCLDVQGASTSSGAVVDQYTCNGNANQNWTLTAMGNNQYEIVSQNSGQCLDVTGSGTANGTLVEQWTCTGEANQLWELTQVASGTYELENVNSGTCLDENGFSTQVGLQMQIYTCNGGTNQQWKISGSPTTVTSPAPVPAPAPAPAPVPATSTSSGVLSGKLVGEWFWPFNGGTTIATIQAQAPELNYLSLGATLCGAPNNGSVGSELVGSGVYSSISALQADIAAWKASGRMILGAIGGGGDSTVISNSTDVSEFMANAVPIIDQLGLQGVDFDLENTPDAASVASIITQLKAHYGPNFIIAISPRPFELRPGGVYRSIIEDVGINNIDLIQPQDYALNGDSLSAQQSYMNSDMSDWINNGSGLSIPANKILIGSFDPGEGESTTTSVQTYDYYKGVYPTLKGSMFWSTGADFQNGWQWANQLSLAP